MADQMIFRRYEIKYMLTEDEAKEVAWRIAPHMTSDCHGCSSIQSLYFDTPDYRMIRHSLEHPIYKEKLRLRSYGIAHAGSPVFMELKKKYRGIVSKRRIRVDEADINKTFLVDRTSHEGCASVLGEDTASPSQISSPSTLRSTGSGTSDVGPTISWTDRQTAREIEYALHRYPDIAPRMLIIYDRDAYYDKNDDQFRVTFDRNIRWRNENLSLSDELYGEQLLGAERVIMEVKAGGAIPLEFSHLITEMRLVRASFSKYGTAYEAALSRGEITIPAGRVSTGASAHGYMYSPQHAPA